MNEYFVDDILEEIMLVEQSSFKSESPMLKQIRESQGIVDNYYSIIDEIYNALLGVEKMPNDTDFSYLIYRLNNYKLRQDCFIKTINVVVAIIKKKIKYL